MVVYPLYNFKVTKNHANKIQNQISNGISIKEKVPLIGMEGKFI
jgi:hypothetical protein